MTKITIYNVKKAITQNVGKLVMVLVFFVSSHGSKHFCKVS